MGHRIPLRGHQFRAGRGHFLAEALGDRAEHPGEAPRLGDGDGAVAVLHRRVRLGPRLGGLAELQAGLVGEPDGPAGAQERDLVGVDPALGELGVQRELGVGGGRGDVMAERGAEVGQGAGGETGLDHGLLVGEAEDDFGGGEGGGGSAADRCDQQARGAALGQAAQDVDDLSGGSRSGQADDAVVAAVPGELRRSERVARSLALALAGGGVRLGDEPRGAASDDCQGFAVAGERGGVDFQCAPPQPRLAGDLFKGLGHPCLLTRLANMKHSFVMSVLILPVRGPLGERVSRLPPRGRGPVSSVGRLSRFPHRNRFGSVGRVARAPAPGRGYAPRRRVACRWLSSKYAASSGRTRGTS